MNAEKTVTEKILEDPDYILKLCGAKQEEEKEAKEKPRSATAYLNELEKRNDDPF